MNTIPSSQNTSTLFEELENLKQSFRFENKEDEQIFYKKNSYLFATTSASLFRLVPQIPYSKHKSIFEKLLFNLQLLTIEEKYAEEFIQNFEINDIENSLKKAQNGQPFLFCCFHTSAYSIIPALLANQSLDFGFLSNQTLTERKGKHFLEIHRNYCEKYSINSTMQLINVEEKKGIWQALRMLKEGKSLIVYADGNTGINNLNTKKDNQNTVRVDFFGEPLQVRQGVAFLSYMCNVPIVPVLSSREYADLEDKKANLNRKYTLLPAIYPNNQITKEEFAATTMQKLYSILEKEVNKDNSKKISEWEGWIFVNNFFEDLKKPLFLVDKNNLKNNFDEKLDKTNQLYIFNEERFAVIENLEKQQNTLFDKFTYRFFPVSDLLYEIIIYFSVPKKLYLFDSSIKLENNEEIDKEMTITSNSPVSTNFDSSLVHSDSKLQLSKTLVSISALEKLIEKKILIHYR